MKVFMFFINTIYWIAIFIVPAGITGFIGLWYYVDSHDNLILSIILVVIGIILGIVLAEFIRRRYGLDNYFGRLSATPDIDGGNIMDKKDENKECER